MLNIGFGEILLIGCLLLVVVGPERLPKILRMAGRQYGKLRRAANELQHAFMDEGDLLDAGLGDVFGGPSAPSVDTPLRQKSELDAQRVPSDPAAAIDKMRAEQTARRAQATQKAQPVQLEPDEGTADEPVERVATTRPVDLASRPLAESQGDD